MAAQRKDETPHATKAPFAYYGGKQAMVHHLLLLLPAHEAYVEVFGGAGSLLMAKPPSTLEVYNDVDDIIVNFFRVLRDKTQRAELIHLLELTPYSRAEWAFCRQHLTETNDPVESARRWFTAISQTFSGRFTSGGWKHSTHAQGNQIPPRAFANATENLWACAQRLRQVQIEHEDFTRLIHAYDAPDVLYYADPPYLPETRRGGGYRHEMTVEQHETLLRTLTTCAGMVILSGYDSPLYREWLADWQLIQVATIASAAGHTRANGMQGKGSAQHQTRNECIWVKPNTVKTTPPPSGQPTLWEVVA